MIKEYKIHWSIPENIGYFISSNEKGYSKNQYKYANFSFNVGDKEDAVKSNINNLKNLCSINNIAFMNQLHTNKTKELIYYKNYRNTDGIFTRNKKIACAVLTADCIPLLVTDKLGTFIGCIHAGWRGLKSNIIEKFFDNIFFSKCSDLKVLIGPSISRDMYEVDSDILRFFPGHTSHFKQNKNGKYNMDIKNIACDILLKIGITDVTISPACTYKDNRLFSYRKNKITGRFISLIWFKR
jgi:YfiH family protein